MSIVIDVILIIVFVIFVIRFSKYGFAKTVYKIGKTWLSLFCSVILGPFVSDKLQAWFLKDMITDGVHTTLVNVVSNNPNKYSLAELFQNLPSGFVKFLENYGIKYAELEEKYGASAQASAEMLRDIADKAGTAFSGLVANIIGHVFCFVFSLVFLWWLNRQIRNRRVAFLRIVDHITGFIIGVAVGYCAALGISVLLSTIFEIILAFDASNPVSEAYQQSYIFKFMNEFDIWGAIKQLWNGIFSK